MIWRIAVLATIAVLMGSSGVPAGAQDRLSDMATLAQDRMAIEDTLRRYVRALDDSDLNAYLATVHFLLHGFQRFVFGRWDPWPFLGGPNTTRGVIGNFDSA